MPDPLIAPGLIVQLPVAGSPFNTTLPVGESHEGGCVTATTDGADSTSTVRVATLEVVLLTPPQFEINERY